MNAYLYTIATILAVAACGKLIWLAKGEFPARNPAHEACDVVINLVLAGIAIYLAMKP